MQDHRRLIINKKQIEDSMHEADVAGVAIAFADNHGPIITEEIGDERNLLKKIKKGTVFACASLTKAAFAYLVLKLIDLKVIDPDKFNLDTKLNDILPFKQFCKSKDINLPWEPTPTDKKAAAAMTVRMVLSHTTGIATPPDKPMQFQFTPGTEYGYSGVPFWYLQKIIEQLTEASLEELGQKYMFDKLALDMPNTHFSGEHKQELVAANSLHTTAEDYVRLMIAWANDPSDIMQEAFKPVIFMTADQWATEGVEIATSNLSHVAWGLGLGLELNDKGDTIAAYHSGDMNEWRAWAAINLEDKNNKTAIVYLANSPNGLMLADQILEPNVPLIHARNYFFQKYGFARVYEPDWEAKQQNRFDAIGVFLDKHSNEVDQRNHSHVISDSPCGLFSQKDTPEKDMQPQKIVQRKPD